MCHRTVGGLQEGLQTAQVQARLLLCNSYSGSSRFFRAPGCLSITRTLTALGADGTAHGSTHYAMASYVPPHSGDSIPGLAPACCRWDRRLKGGSNGQLADSFER